MNNMKWADEVNRYIESEINARTVRLSCYLSMVLECFCKYLENNKTGGWRLQDITEEDIIKFYLSNHGDGEADADRYLAEIRRFMKFIKKNK